MTATAMKLSAIREQLNAAFFERRNAIEALLLATLAGEHAFILGPPGTAKSQLVRAFVDAVVGARYFEVALSKTRPAEAVLGPLDIKKFRDEGSYHLKTDGFLLTADLAFIDEIGKMSPVLGHDMLAALNERLRHEVNGTHSVHRIPLSSAFCANNEMLTDDSDDAAALWDRLLVRTSVDYLQDKGNFARLLRADAGQAPTQTIPWDELRAAIQSGVPSVKLSDATVDAVVRLRGEFAREHLYPSDRRWRACVKLLQASAFLDGRTETDENDLAVLRFALWDTVDQVDKVERLCMGASNPFVEPLFDIRGKIQEVDDAISEREGQSLENRAAYGREASNKLAKARDELDLLLLRSEGRKIPGFKIVSDQHRSTLIRNYIVCMDSEPDVAESIAAKKLGQGDGGNE